MKDHFVSDAPLVLIVARIKAPPHGVADVRAILMGLIEPTRNKAGCITYELWQTRRMRRISPSLRRGKVRLRLTDTQQASILRLLTPELDGLIKRAPDVRRYSLVL